MAMSQSLRTDESSPTRHDKLLPKQCPHPIPRRLVFKDGLEAQLSRPYDCPCIVHGLLFTWEHKKE